MANTLKFKRGLVAGIPTAALGEPLFTTDTFDLYIGNGTGNTRFQKYIASGATTQILRGDGSLYTFPLNISSPSNGQVLKYDGTNWVNGTDSGITGSGTTNYLPKFTGASTLGNSLLQEQTNSIGLGLTPSAWHANTKVLESGLGSFFGTFNPAASGGDIWIGNNLYYDGTLRYANSSKAAVLYAQYSGKYEWYTAPSGTAGNAATLTVRMLLDNNGNLGLGVTPSAWLAGVRAFEIFSKGNAIVSSTSSQNLITANAYFDGAWKYGSTAAASYYSQLSGAHSWFTAASGTINTAITWSQPMTLTANGRLLLGTTTEGTQRLQVAGDVKFDADAATNGFYWDNTNKRLGIGVSGASYKLDVVNAGGNTIRVQNTASTADAYLLAQNTLGSTFFGINATGGYIYNGGALPILFYTSGAERMRIDANGSVGIGTTSPQNPLHINAAAGASHARWAEAGTTRGFVGGANGIISGITGYFAIRAEAGLILSGQGNAINLAIHPSTGNVIINNSTTDSGEKLQVTGTMKVTGASTFTITGNNIATFESTNANGGYITLRRSGTDFMYIGNSSAVGGGANNVDIYATTGNGIRLFTNTNISPALTIATTNAATFSSSVTAARYWVTPSGSSLVYNFVNATETYTGAYVFQAGGGSAGYGGSIIAYGHSHATKPGWISSCISASSGGKFSVNTSGLGAGSDVFTVDASGVANLTNTLQVTNAIAIGTTPDTNKPFKILKSINGTVGINFENTSTGALAFSAIQFGTDVTGATAFGNLVYASSGITEAGVYKPSGTALINTGSGGLNFLSVSQPIRFFTSTGNGTERVRITNDGDITQYNGTNPSASTTDAFRMYSADITAGNAAPHFRTENGAVIKLYQETTAVGNSIISLGGGNAVLDDTTFDGYTLRQIVKALRNQGILQ